MESVARGWPTDGPLCWQLQRIKGELRRRPTKTVSSEAPLPLPNICTRALAHRKMTEARSRLAAGEAWMGSGLVLTTRYGTPIDPRNFQCFFQARAAKADVPGATRDTIYSTEAWSELPTAPSAAPEVTAAPPTGTPSSGYSGISTSTGTISSASASRSSPH